MSRPYKICFLGYGALIEMAQTVIDSLDYNDVDILLEDCNIETLPKTVDNALSLGYKIFVAGAANAAEFKRYSYEHLIEIRLSTVDYLLAIKKALQIGKKPVIAAYRFGRLSNLSLLEQLSGTEVQTILYEDSSELYNKILNTDADVIIGASHANAIAEEFGKKSIFLYAGEESVRNAIQRARSLAIELEKSIWSEKTSQAIINYAPFGLIVNDAQGKITVFNRTARQQTNIMDAHIQGKYLSDIIPSLSPGELLQTEKRQLDQRHLINGAMIRCVQTRIEDNQKLIGVLTTLYPDNTRRKKQDDPALVGFSAQRSWSDVVCQSQSMQEAVRKAKTFIDQTQPLVIEGEAGTGKNFIAQCIHNGSLRAQEPYVTVNTAIIPDHAAAKVLFGVDEVGGSCNGLAEMAQGGTIVFQNLENASPTVQACILQLLTERKFLRLGGISYIPFRAKIITVVNGTGKPSNVKDELWQRLSVLRLPMPPLRERTEDIPTLFDYFLSYDSNLPLKKINSGKSNELLRFYSWPGNLIELASTSKRYIFLLQQVTNPTANARQLLLIQAIGEDNLFQEILRKYPALTTPSSSLGEEVLAGIDAIKTILGYNNEKIGEMLSLSRTTLWRLKKNVEESRN